MKKSTKKVIALTAGTITSAAIAGLLTGSAYAYNGNTSGISSTQAVVSVAMAGVSDLANEGGGHDCAGHNECKGKGGCKTGDNGCKGKNSCKGKGGCATNTEKH